MGLWDDINKGADDMWEMEQIEADVNERKSRFNFGDESGKADGVDELDELDEFDEFDDDFDEFDEYDADDYDDNDSDEYDELDDIIFLGMILDDDY